jgi:hypothetical protein
MQKSTRFRRVRAVVALLLQQPDPAEHTTRRQQPQRIDPRQHQRKWIPAFAGMTVCIGLQPMKCETMGGFGQLVLGGDEG